MASGLLDTVKRNEGRKNFRGRTGEASFFLSVFFCLALKIMYVIQSKFIGREVKSFEFSELVSSGILNRALFANCLRNLVFYGDNFYWPYDVESFGALLKMKVCDDSLDVASLPLA